MHLNESKEGHCGDCEWAYSDGFRFEKRAEVMLAEMGLNMTTAMTVFLRQIVRQGKIPFEIATDILNAQTLETIAETEDIIFRRISATRYNSVETLFEDLDA